MMRWVILRRVTDDELADTILPEAYGLYKPFRSALRKRTSRRAG